MFFHQKLVVYYILDYFGILFILDINSVLIEFILWDQRLLKGWSDDLRFYVLFNSISVISGRCLDDNERLYAMELRLRMRRFHLE